MSSTPLQNSTYIHLQLLIIVDTASVMLTIATAKNIIRARKTPIQLRDVETNLWDEKISLRINLHHNSIHAQVRNNYQGLYDYRVIPSPKTTDHLECVKRLKV